MSKSTSANKIEEVNYNESGPDSSTLETIIAEFKELNIKVDKVISKAKARKNKIAIKK